ncbi:MAG TPA: aminopeptidase, partial [Thermodesulfobacteriota bacterium]
MDRMRTAALIAARDCMAIKQDENVLVITDEPLRKIGYALWEASKQVAAEAIITEIIPRRSNGEEPPLPVAELMKIV